MLTRIIKSRSEEHSEFERCMHCIDFDILAKNQAVTPTILAGATGWQSPYSWRLYLQISTNMWAPGSEKISTTSTTKRSMKGDDGHSKQNYCVQSKHKNNHLQKQVIPTKPHVHRPPPPATDPKLNIMEETKQTKSGGRIDSSACKLICATNNSQHSIEL